MQKLLAKTTVIGLTTSLLFVGGFAGKAHSSEIEPIEEEPIIVKISSNPKTAGTIGYAIEKDTRTSSSAQPEIGVFLDQEQQNVMAEIQYDYVNAVLRIKSDNIPPAQKADRIKMEITKCFIELYLIEYDNMKHEEVEKIILKELPILIENVVKTGDFNPDEKATPIIAKMFIPEGLYYSMVTALLFLQ